MSQNQEIIEARLCAYIDGELDPDGRAEIEKHLEANPQHRRLLESLRATRDLLKWLPREPAPAELSETINGQLERSVLLDYVGDAQRPRAWQRVFAAAAIVLLTAGLGVAVFYVLPRSQKPSLAIHTFGSDSDSAHKFSLDAPPAAPSSSPPSSPADADKQTDALARLPESESVKEMAASKSGGDSLKSETVIISKSGEFDAKPANEPAPAIAPAAPNGGEIDQLVEQVAQNPQVLAAPMNGALASSQPAVPQLLAQNAVVMLVRSDAPQQTEKQLTAYLDSQQIPWRQTQFPQPKEQPPEQQQTLNFQATANNQSLGDQTLAENNAAAQSPRIERMEKKALAVGAASVTSPAQTQPALVVADSVNAQQAVMPAPAPNLSGEVSQSASILRQTDNAANASPFHPNNVFVVRMSRLQCAELSTTMSRDANRAAQVKDVSAGPVGGIAPTTEPAGAASQPAEKQVITVVTRAVGQETTRLSPAPGADREEARTRTTAGRMGIAAASGMRSLDDAKAPATQPASDGLGGKLGLAGKEATTQPAEGAPALSVASADEPVNVVIMIEGNSSPVSAAAPAVPSTQPAAPPTTQPIENAK